MLHINIPQSIAVPKIALKYTTPLEYKASIANDFVYVLNTSSTKMPFRALFYGRPKFKIRGGIEKSKV